MFTVFQNRSANQVWCDVFDKFDNDDSIPQKGSRVGLTSEILHAAITIEKPGERWITARRPALNPAFALVEVLWILLGRNDSKLPNHFNRKLPEYAGKGLVYDGAYGDRLRNHFKIDQLHRAYQVLSKNPESRQVVLQIWDPCVDLPKESGAPSSPDIPCNLLSMLKVHNGALEWTQIMRSNDLFLGLPYNVVQYTYLQEILAGWLELEVGHYNHISDSLHVYHDFKGSSSSCANTEVLNSDRFTLARDEFFEQLSLVECELDNLVNGAVAENSWLDHILSLKIDQVFINMLLLIFAESARRQKQSEIEEALIGEVSNPIFRELYSAWKIRYS